MLRAAMMEPLHIGKHSYGWEFCFQSVAIQRGVQSLEGSEFSLRIDVKFSLDIKSWDEWKAVLQRGGLIRNESHELVSFDDFVEMVETRAAPGVRRNDGQPLLNHFEEMKRHGHSVARDWLDNRGYSFTSTHFS
jgi:hypothetical protein